MRGFIAISAVNPILGASKDIGRHESLGSGVSGRPAWVCLRSERTALLTRVITAPERPLACRRVFVAQWSIASTHRSAASKSATAW